MNEVLVSCLLLLATQVEGLLDRKQTYSLLRKCGQKCPNLPFVGCYVDLKAETEVEDSVVKCSKTPEKIRNEDVQIDQGQPRSERNSQKHVDPWELNKQEGQENGDEKGEEELGEDEEEECTKEAAKMRLNLMNDRTWDRAVQKCKKHGRLVVINCKAKQEKVEKYLKDSRVSNDVASAPWIGLRDFNEDNIRLGWQHSSEVH